MEKVILKGKVINMKNVDLYEGLKNATRDIPSLGICVVNCTPHNIDLLDIDSKVIRVPSSSCDGSRFGSLTLNAQCVEKRIDNSLKMQRVYLPTENGRKILKYIKTNISRVSSVVASDRSNLYIIGSVLSAQAYAPDVVSMLPASPKDDSVLDKIMRADAFQIFSRQDDGLPTYHGEWSTTPPQDDITSTNELILSKLMIDNATPSQDNEPFEVLLSKLMNRATENNIKLNISIE